MKPANTHESFDTKRDFTPRTKPKSLPHVCFAFDGSLAATREELKKHLRRHRGIRYENCRLNDAARAAIVKLRNRVNKSDPHTSRFELATNKTGCELTSGSRFMYVN